MCRFLTAYLLLYSGAGMNLEAGRGHIPGAVKISHSFRKGKVNV